VSAGTLNEDAFDGSERLKHVTTVFRSAYNLFRPQCSCGWSAPWQPHVDIADILIEQHIEHIGRAGQ
jgi:hypothetical protein